jgi:hypothetical protein
MIPAKMTNTKPARPQIGASTHHQDQGITWLTLRKVSSTTSSAAQPGAPIPEVGLLAMADAPSRHLSLPENSPRNQPATQSRLVEPIGAALPPRFLLRFPVATVTDGYQFTGCRGCGRQMITTEASDEPRRARHHRRYPRPPG